MPAHGLCGFLEPEGAVEAHHMIGEFDDPFQTVLGHDHGDREIVHEAMYGGEYLLGRGGVQRAGRLVENENRRPRGQR